MLTLSLYQGPTNSTTMPFIILSNYKIIPHEYKSVFQVQRKLTKDAVKINLK